MDWIAAVLAALVIWGMSNWSTPINIVSSDAPPPQASVLASTGVSTYRCGIIVYDKFHQGELVDWQIVIDHEVGHCLGLNHIPQDGIMNASYNYGEQMTIWDWVEFWHHYPLPYQLRAPMLTQD